MYKDKWIRGRKYRVKTDDAETWEEMCIILTKQWINYNKWIQTSEKVIVRIWFYWKDNRRRDTHNCLKLLLDSLQKAGVYHDDQTALPQIMDYEVNKKNPRIEIEFELLNKS